MRDASSNIKQKRERNVAFDVIRILAAFSVVMLHAAAQFWYEIPVTEMDWKISNAYDACVRFGVPLFVMISGALFLDKGNRPNISRLLKHNVLRLMIINFVWSAVYGLLDCYQFGFANLTAKEIVKEMLGGRYHLWFLPMLAGIYVISPILYELVQKLEKSTLEYFLTLFLILQIGRCTVYPYITNPELLHILSWLEIPLVCGYTGYFVLGYYLQHYGISEKIYGVLKVLLIPSLLYNILSSTWLSLKLETPRGETYDCFCLGTFIMVVFLFMWGKRTFALPDYNNDEKNISRSGKYKWLEEISQSTFGVYLMHVGVLEVGKTMGIHVGILPMVVGIPLGAILVFLGCLMVATLLRKIPFVGRFIC